MPIFFMWWVLIIGMQQFKSSIKLQIK